MPGGRAAGHAIANGVYVAAVNRTGVEARRTTAWSSGGIPSWPSVRRGSGRGAGDREETLVVECDPARAEEVRRNWPFFRDRRIDAYGD